MVFSFLGAGVSPWFGFLGVSRAVTFGVPLLVSEAVCALAAGLIVAEREEPTLPHAAARAIVITIKRHPRLLRILLCDVPNSSRVLDLELGTSHKIRSP